MKVNLDNLQRTDEPDLATIRNAWLSPDGQLVVDHEEFEGWAWHEDLARCIIGDLYQAGWREWGKHKPYGCFYEYLESVGWIRFCGWSGKHGRWIIANVVTVAQREVINRWIEIKGTTWDEAV